MASVWTAPVTWTSLNVVTAAQLNTHVRDNLTFLHTFRGCSAYKAADMNIADSTFTDFLMDTELFDTDGFHSTSVNTNRFTVPTGLAGYYQISGEVAWAGSAVGLRQARIYLNNTTQISADRMNPGSNQQTFPCTTLYHLVVGDYVTWSVYQSSGGTLAAQGGSAATMFRMAWLGV